jgi:selenocysteine lyase/cysteine desulfurase
VGLESGNNRDRILARIAELLFPKTNALSLLTSIVPMTTKNTSRLRETSPYKIPDIGKSFPKTDFIVTVLEKKKIIVSARAKGIRVSTHFYNNEEDVDRLIDCRLEENTPITVTATSRYC